MQKRSFIFIYYFFIILITSTACDREINEPSVNGSEFPDYDFPEGKVWFSYPPVALEGVIFAEPRGWLDPPPSPHGAFHHKQLFVENPDIPVYAMADGLVITMNHGYDYQFLVQYSTTVWVKYGHVGRLNGQLAERFGDTRNARLEQVWIPVVAGDTLGFVEKTAALDIQVADTTVELDHVYPEDYRFEDRYSALLTDYYQEPLKSQIISLSMRKSPPYLGKTDYDISGKLIGNWFLEGNDQIYQNAFTIAYNHLFGNRVQIRDGFFQHRPSPNHNKIFSAILKNNRPKPDTIGPEHGMIKFEVIFFGHGVNFDETANQPVLVDTINIDQRPVDGVFLLEMIGPERLKVESFSGKTADQVSGFTPQARIYNRKRSK